MNAEQMSKFSRLTGEYLVDAWSAVEEARLTYLRHNQHSDPEEAEYIGTGDEEPVDDVRLPSTFVHLPACTELNAHRYLLIRLSQPHIDKLKERWPENDDGKSIYKDEKGLQRELTQIRLSIWAAHIARGTATLDKAPLPTQFDIKYRLKASSVAAPLPVAPLLPQPGPGPTPSSTDKILELLAMSMMMQQQQHHQPSHSCAFAPISLAHRSVSLTEFCTYYDIPQHLEKLEKLEYELGDGGIMTLGQDDWQQVAVFSKLAWDKVLSKHKQFVKDVPAGVWA
ncbi:hypothetical protein B0H14DRAFT_3492646 [Mycena olivaceomarginata]|nr:hypothetical protein B0H14DRAFT_3492646 [Mycena olivaceomarginata]